MTKLVEYRIPAPITVDNYRVGQVYTTAKYALEDLKEGGGKEGVEWIKNEKFLGEDGKTGRYTEKLIRVGSKIPGWVQYFISADKMVVEERSWDSYPYCKTEYVTHLFSRDTFYLCIESIYLDDDGSTENALNLTGDDIKRSICNIDLFGDKEDEILYGLEYEPGSIGPCVEGWQKAAEVISCAYKLVTVRFAIPFVSGRLESLIQNRAFKDIFADAHKKMFHWIEEWFGLTIEESHEYEQKMNDEGKKVRIRES